MTHRSFSHLLVVKAVAILGWSTNVQAIECISLRSAHGRYLVAEENHSAAANRTAVGAWEKWDVIDHGRGMVSLMSAHGRYLVAEQNHSVSANRTDIGAWERWNVIDHSDGTISLKSAQGRYLVAETVV